MARSAERLTAECPRCGQVFETWALGAPDLDCDPELGDPLMDDFLIKRQGLSYGLELMARRPPGERLHGWLAYTLSRPAADPDLSWLPVGIICGLDRDTGKVRWPSQTRTCVVLPPSPTPAEFDTLPM